jgi:sRNA-binding carbon storage regulator CsrA
MPLSLDQIAHAVENGSHITAMANDISALMTMVQQNTVRLAVAAPEPVSVDVNQTTQLHFARLHTQYKQSSDVKCEVPTCPFIVPVFHDISVIGHFI